MRQVVLDTETTGLETSQDHRIIEIGAVELVNRRLTGNHYHQYVNPQREVDAGALEVHGINEEFLSDKPEFALIAEEFLAFVEGAELIIHNAPFDVGFINHEFGKFNGEFQPIETYCRVTDTLQMARQKHPGQRNSLDALCKRYQIDNSQRELHGALLDAELLADVYLAMTGGQVKLNIGDQSETGGELNPVSSIRRLAADRPPLRVIMASPDELARHARRLEAIQNSSGQCVWLDSETS